MRQGTSVVVLTVMLRSLQHTRPHPRNTPPLQTHIGGYFANTFATVRAQSMKSWVAGLRVRFLNVRIPVGLRVVGKSIGSAVIFGFPVESFSADRGTTLRKRPVAARAARAGMV